MEGLIGLTKGIQDKDQAIQDLSVLERLDQRVQMDRQQEVLAQQQEQAMYEKMYQTADGMLEKDRVKINKKILASQAQIRQHLDASGGSRKAFMESGGLSALNQISNSIIHSDEAERYKENKKNLAKILELQEKGLGHLISPTDLRTLEDYKNNEDGATITFSGVLNEIQLPPSDAFDYGKDIPIENIMSFGSNAVKLRQNYAIAYPERPEPTWAQLREFAKEMGYGGVGTNINAMRMQMEEDKRRRAYEQQTDTKSKTTLVGSLTNMMNSIPPGLTVDKIDKEYGGSVIEWMKGQGTKIEKILGDKSSITSQKRSLDKKGVDFRDVFNFIISPGSAIGKWINDDSPDPGMILDVAQKVFNSDLRLRDSYNIAQGNEMTIAQRVLGMGDSGGGYKIEGGQIIDYEPSEKDYRMDGVRLTGDNKLAKDKYKGNYKILGFTTALKAYDSQGETDMLLVEALDGKGKVDPDVTNRITQGYTQNAQMTTVLAMENEDGHVFYREVNLRDIDMGTAISNSLGADNNLTEVVEQENKMTEDLVAIEKNTLEQKIAFETAINTFQNQVFEDTAFKAEGEQFFGGDSAKQQNRYGMMKSFYMAYDFVNNRFNGENPNGPQLNTETTRQAVDQRRFTIVTEAGKIGKDLRTYDQQGNNAETMIKKWLFHINEDLKPGSLERQQNELLASKWYQLYQMM